MPMQETCVRSLGWEDPLEKEMATHSSILAWEIPWTETRRGIGGSRVRKVQQGNSGGLRVAKAKAVVGRGHSSGEAG